MERPEYDYFDNRSNLPRMNKLHAMGTFATICDRGSLTAAAESLNTSLPTVVRTLAALEKELGVRLLNRTTRRIALTEEGRYYLERCRRVLADIDDAELGLSAQQKEPSGTLSVTASVMFGRMHLAPAVTAFLKQFPGTRVEMLLLDRLVGLVEEGIDVGIRIGTLSDSSLVAVPVGRSVLHLLDSRRPRRARAEPLLPRKTASARREDRLHKRHPDAESDRACGRGSR